MSKVSDFTHQLSPRLWWQTYRKSVYGSGPIIPQQEKECSNAFYAGIEAAMQFMESASASPDLSEDECLEAVHLFRRLNNLAAKSQNPTGKN